MNIVEYNIHELKPADFLKFLSYDKPNGKLYWKKKKFMPQLEGQEAGWINSGGYRVVKIFGKQILVHRLIYFIERGYFSPSTDHINRDKLDNRFSNLRECTQAQNCMNRSLNKNSKSGYRGVYKEKKVPNKWRGEICCKGKKYFLGYFDSKDECAIAYNNKAVELFGEFAVLNEVS